MPRQSLQAVLLLCLLATGANAFRKKQKNKDAVNEADVSLRERSGSAESLVEDKEVSLDEAVVRKGDNRRRRRRRRASKNGHCLPHQKCTYWDCCALGTSCRTCPAGYHGEKAFGRCAWKGHFVCNSRDCTGEWSAWSTCSAQCGGGTRHQYFKYTNDASPGGRGCDYHNGQKKTEACNTHACPVNCQGQWSEYGECSATCGPGTKTRTFSVSIAAAHNGAQCSANNGQTESKACNLKKCCPEYAAPDLKNASRCIDEMTEEDVDASCCHK